MPEPSGDPAAAYDVRLAVSSERVFTDLPHLERVRRLDELGLDVEIWDWTRKDVAALVATGATFSSMTGDVTGRLADREGADELLRTAEQSVRVASRLGCPRLDLHGTGLGPDGLPVVPAREVTGPVVALQRFREAFTRPARSSSPSSSPPPRHSEETA